MCSPTTIQITTGIVVTLGGLVIAAYAARVALTQRNPFWALGSLGAVVFVIGVVGQRAYYLNAGQTTGCPKTAAPKPGIWDASIPLPFTPFHLTLFSLVGLLVLGFGLALVLFFERVGEADSGYQAGRSVRPLEEMDTV